MTTTADFKADLVHYLQEARDVVLLKTEGLSEYDLRRPLTPTATNLLGLVKHLALVEAGYFTVPFGRPVGLAHPWFSDDAEDNVDMWATAEVERGDHRRLPPDVDARGRDDRGATDRRPWPGALVGA